MPIKERFLSHVKVLSQQECWPWLAHHSPKGYGYFNFEGKNIQSHRISYMLFIGPLPEGKEVDHLCRNRICQNPWHLQAVTHIVNLHRRIGSRKGTHNRLKRPLKAFCLKGHPFDESNTYIDKYGHRQCKMCKRERNKLAKRKIASERRIDVYPQQSVR